MYHLPGDELSEVEVASATTDSGAAYCLSNVFVVAFFPAAFLSMGAACLFNLFVTGAVLFTFCTIWKGSRSTALADMHMKKHQLTDLKFLPKVFSKVSFPGGLSVMMQCVRTQRGALGRIMPVRVWKNEIKGDDMRQTLICQE